MRCLVGPALTIIASTFSLFADAALVELTGVVQLSEGGAHRCVVTTQGAAKCWGRNHAGQLGDGTSGNDRAIAGDVVGLTSGVTAVSTGLDHTCALLASGAVKCWGGNGSGQLGNGSTSPSLTAVDVIGLGAGAVQISAGRESTCAVLADTSLKCWGYNREGQLGDGTTQDRSLPVSVIGLPSGVVEVSTWYGHTCAVTTGGGALCWGANFDGQLGDGTTTSRLTPVSVASLSSGVATVRVSGGYNSGVFDSYLPPTGHSCAVMTNGGAKCWGANRDGQVGDGTTTQRLTPFDVQELTSGVGNLSLGHASSYGSRGVQGNSGFTCAATTAGAVKCWGRECWFRGADCGSGWGPSVLAPVLIDGLASGVVRVSAGHANPRFNCVLTTDLRVLCWGRIPGSPSPSDALAAVLTGTQAQTITFGAAPSVGIGGTGILSASASSGLAVSFGSLTPSICSVSGSSISGLASGLCTIAANQAGNAYYEPAPQVTQTFRIGPPLSQAITFGPPPSVIVNGVGSLSATASSGLAVSFDANTPSICSVSGNVVTGLGIGSCTVTATQSGDVLYAAAPQVTQTINVAANSGSYGMVVTRAGSGVGTVTSNPAGIDCGSICGANFAAGTIVSLAAAAQPNSAFTGWSGSCSGTGNCLITMNALHLVTATFSLATTVPRLVNISTRMQVLTGDRVLIGGFIIGGTAPKSLVIRARGPSLAQFGLTGLLANPKLDLYSGQTLIGSNDDWQDASNASALSASGFAPDSAVESAILVTLSPGAYTAIVSGNSGGTGIGIVEVFEIDRADMPLINISTRGQVLTANDVMIGGFIIQGSGAKTVVVRARGPSLTALGVPGALANPVLNLYSGQTVIASNDNWQSAINSAALRSSGFAPADSNEAAILITLNPGAYTAIVSGAGGGTGVGIVEVFAIP